MSAPFPPSANAFIQPKAPNLRTWHGRLGHACHQTVLDMFTNKATKGMTLDLLLHPGSCHPCILGKQVMASVPKVRVGPESTRLRLEKVFIDVTGPFVHLTNGTLYNMAIINNYSSFPWNYQL
ncbi:hypothetical protein BDV98DRAFT_514736, partial [Pterulicium gracile]